MHSLSHPPASAHSLTHSFMPSFTHRLDVFVEHLPLGLHVIQLRLQLGTVRAVGRQLHREEEEHMMANSRQKKRQNVVNTDDGTDCEWLAGWPLTGW